MRKVGEVRFQEVEQHNSTTICLSLSLPPRSIPHDLLVVWWRRHSIFFFKERVMLRGRLSRRLCAAASPLSVEHSERRLEGLEKMLAVAESAAAITHAPLLASFNRAEQGLLKSISDFHCQFRSLDLVTFELEMLLQTMSSLAPPHAGASVAEEQQWRRKLDSAAIRAGAAESLQTRERSD
jgi:hypothetical protein